MDLAAGDAAGFTCRRLTPWPLRGPAVMSSVTVVAARRRAFAAGEQVELGAENVGIQRG